MNEETIRNLKTEINYLEVEIDRLKSQKAVLEIIDKLNNATNHNFALKDAELLELFSFEISSNVREKFTSLLEPCEYLKGMRHVVDTNYNKKIDINNYILSIGPRTLIELGFREWNDNRNNSKNVTNDTYGFLHYNKSGFTIEIDDYNHGYIKNIPYIRILTEEGFEVCCFNADPEYLSLNNKKISEVLTPISINNLANRYFDKLKEIDGSQKVKRLT